MGALLSDFYSLLTSLFSLLPSLLRQLVLAITGTFILLGLLKMFKR